MQGGAQHQHPFAPCAVAVRGTTGSLTLIALSRKYLVPTVIRASYPCSLTRLTLRHPRGDPGIHGLRCRPGQRSRRHVPVLVPRKICAGVQRPPLPIANKQQPSFVQPGPNPLDDREVSAIIGSFTRQHIRRQRPPQGGQRSQHHFELGPRRLIFALAQLY